MKIAGICFLLLAGTFIYQYNFVENDISLLKGLATIQVILIIVAGISLLLYDNSHRKEVNALSEKQDLYFETLNKKIEESNKKN
jgi:hypothetical protein